MITIVDYGVCNVGSVRNVLRHCGFTSTIASKPEAIAEASKLILPGIGHFSAGMEKLTARGLTGALIEAVHTRGVPILGICLGMQLLGARSDESETPGLDLIDARAVAFDKTRMGPDLKIPHMGWNAVEIGHANCLTGGMNGDTRYYFAHSYHMQVADEADVTLWCDYGYPFAAAVNRGNIYGVQFHPEKSHRFGRSLIDNFARYA